MSNYQKHLLISAINNIKKLFMYILINIYNSDQKIKHFRKKGTHIGEGCKIFSINLSTEPYLLRIGDHVFISEGVYFANHNGATWILREKIPDIQAFGPIIVKNNCYIGKNVIVFPNVTIGNNCIIRAESVVISNIPDNSIVMGAPARVIGKADEYKKTCIKFWEEQKPPDCIIEKGHNWWSSKHFKANQKKLQQHLQNLF